MSSIDHAGVARDLTAAFERRQMLAAPPSSTIPGFDLAAGYAVEAELVRARRAAGRTIVGRKVGYANRAMWRALKLETLVWAHMYDDTVRDAPHNAGSVSVASMISPKIEPEIVFRLSGSPAEGADAAGTLQAVEWIALGFEIIDCPYADWKFQPADFVAGYGLHAALVVGETHVVEEAAIPSWIDALPSFKVTLSRDGTTVAEGGGRNSLRSPALCLAELAAVTRRYGATPLEAGEIISSGTLTESQPIAAGESWTATVEGIDLPALSVRVRA
jgi:2-oxo-3-hexenedioate decarboxylase